MVTHLRHCSMAKTRRQRETTEGEVRRSTPMTSSLDSCEDDRI
jgi:hypothetical protein